MNGIVLVVDDDQAVRESVGTLLRSAGVRSAMFASADELLRHPLPAEPACLVLDVHLPGLSGPELQAELRKRDRMVPIVFLTGRGTIPIGVRAIKDGAIEFLTKPFDPDQLLAAVAEGLRQDDQARALRAKLGMLTPRERDVFGLVVQGRLNKQIAAAFKITEQTVKLHRGRVMRKLGAGSVAELVRLAQAVESAGARPK